MIDILLYSHHLPAWYSIDTVRRNSVLVTCGSERVKQLKWVGLLTQPCLHTFCRRVCNSPQKKFLIGRTEFTERNTVLTLWSWPIDIINLVFNVRECKLLSNSKTSKTLVFDMAPLWKKWPFLSKLTVNKSQLNLKVSRNSLERQHFYSSWLFMLNELKRRNYHILRWKRQYYTER